MTAVRNPQLVHILDKMNYQSKEKVEATLSDADRIILLLKEKGALRIKEIASCLNLSIYKTRKNVRELITEKSIEKIGQSVNTKYKSR